MNISNEIYPANNVYNATPATNKTNYANINTVTAEDIVESIKSLGAVSVVLDNSDYCCFADSSTGLNINISPAFFKN